MRRKSETSSYEGGGEVGYSVLGILSTAGGAECTLRIPKRQKKDIEISSHLFLKNSLFDSQPRSILTRSIFFAKT